jgi:hypothetical protein
MHLAILYLLIIRPTRTPILSGSFRRALATICCTRASSGQVTSGSSRRLAATVSQQTVIDLWVQGQLAGCGIPLRTSRPTVAKWTPKCSAIFR